MFSYYGSKSKIVKYYPKPKYNTIIEPFAGSARYSLEHFENDIMLYEIYEKVFRIWKYLICSKEKDILSLPDLSIGDDIRNFKLLSDVERWLIGYQLQRGNARPGNIVNKRCRWNTDKKRIASNIYKVKHWKVFRKNGIDVSWNNASVFVDPPYQNQTHKYTHHKVDYNKIANKIKNDNGQMIVCGNSNDSWIKFEPLVEMMGNNKKHIECIYVKN